MARRAAWKGVPVPIRTQAEAIAETEAVEADSRLITASLQAKAEAAQKAQSATKIVTDTVRALAEDARKAAVTARTAASEGKMLDAEALILAARAASAEAAKLGHSVAPPPALGDPKDEWKECRNSIDRFDKLLVDLRKTGFGFLTAIVSGAALLLAQNVVVGGQAVAALPQSNVLAIKSAVFFIIAILILVLYFVDRVHGIWLREAVARATQLEGQLGYSLTINLSAKIEPWVAHGVGLAIYLAFYAATAVVFWMALDLTGVPWLSNSYLWFVAICWLVGSAIILATGIISARR